MANNSIGAYAQGGSNDIGAYEKAAAGGAANPKSPLSGVSLFGPFAGPICLLIFFVL